MPQVTQVKVTGCHVLLPRRGVLCSEPGLGRSCMCWFCFEELVLVPQVYPDSPHSCPTFSHRHSWGIGSIPVGIGGNVPVPGEQSSVSQETVTE